MSTQIVSILSVLYGGGEGSRTPVRKFFHIAFYECSLFIRFPKADANKQAKASGIL